MRSFVPAITGSVLVLSFITLAGCGSGTDRNFDTIVADSAGIALMTGPAEDRPLDWTLTELFRVGGADTGPGSFTSVHPTTVGTDAAGRIYVFDGSQFRVEVFDKEGEHVRTFGARGAGPGELRFTGQMLVLPSGEVLVQDYSKRAFVRWTADGEILAERPTSELPTGFEVIRMFRDTLVYTASTTDDRLRREHLRIATPSDTIELTSLANPTAGMVMFTCVGLNLPPLFHPQLAWGSNGARIAVTHQVPYRIDLYEQGRLVHSVRRAIASEVPGLAHVERAYPRGITIGMPSGDCVVPASEMAEKQGMAEQLPLVSGVVVGPDGYLWAERFGIGDEIRRTDVFDPSGRYVGTVSGKRRPLGFFGDDTVLFGETNADTDITQLVAYRITGR